jgi:DNA-binding response OmpR family regulator
VYLPLGDVGDDLEASPMRILLLEDDLETATALEKGLSLERHEVSVALRVRDALGLIASQTFDAAVLDISVPGGSGFDVLAEIRASQKAMQVLMLTARGKVKERTGERTTTS